MKGRWSPDAGVPHFMRYVCRAGSATPEDNVRSSDVLALFRFMDHVRLVYGARAIVLTPEEHAALPPGQRRLFQSESLPDLGDSPPPDPPPVEGKRFALRTSELNQQRRLDPTDVLSIGIRFWQRMAAGGGVIVISGDERRELPPHVRVLFHAQEQENAA